MNRGFKTYFRYGRQEAKKVFKKKGNLFRYYLFQLMNMISYLLPFLRPVLQLAGVRMARIAAKSNNIEVTESFETSNKPQSYWTALLSGLIQFMIILSGAIIIILLYAIVLSIFESFITSSNSMHLRSNVELLVTIPFVIMLICYIVLVNLYFAPRSFYIDSVDNMTATKALTKSYCTMKQKVKKTVFTLKLIPYLVFIAIGLVYVFLMGEAASFPMGFPVLIICIAIILLLILLPRFFLIRDIALIQLYKDNIIDKINVVKTLDNIKVKSFKEVPVGMEDAKDSLVKLFDETQDIEYKEPEFNELVDDDVKPEPTNEVKEEVKEEQSLDINKDESLNLDDLSDLDEEEINEEPEINNEETNDEDVDLDEELKNLQQFEENLDETSNELEDEDKE